MRLIDADVLKKRIVNEPVKAVQDVDFQAEWFTRIADTVCHMIDMVDEAPTVAASPWHRVDDELPPDGVTVWCAIYSTDLVWSMPGESVSEAMMRCQKEAAKHPRCEMGTYYKGEGWSECLFGAPMVCTPKYWCYLPEPPKEDKL